MYKKIVRTLIVVGVIGFVAYKAYKYFVKKDDEVDTDFLDEQEFGIEEETSMDKLKGFVKSLFA